MELPRARSGIKEFVSRPAVASTRTVVTCGDEVSVAGSAWLGRASWEKTCGAASENASVRAAKQTRRNLPQKLDLVGASRQYFMFFPGRFFKPVDRRRNRRHCTKYLLIWKNEKITA